MVCDVECQIQIKQIGAVQNALDIGFGRDDNTTLRRRRRVVSKQGRRSEGGWGERKLRET